MRSTSIHAICAESYKTRGGSLHEAPSLHPILRLRLFIRGRLQLRRPTERRRLRGASVDQREEGDDDHHSDGHE